MEGKSDGSVDSMFTLVAHMIRRSDILIALGGVEILPSALLSFVITIVSKITYNVSRGC